MTLRSKCLMALVFGALLFMTFLLLRERIFSSNFFEKSGIQPPQAAAFSKNIAPAKIPEAQKDNQPHPWTEQLRRIRLILPTLKELDRNIQRYDFLHDAFSSMDTDPIQRQIALATLTQPGASRALFGEEQGLARVFFIEYLAHVDRKEPEEGLIPLAIRLLSQRKNMQRGQDQDIEELLYYYLTHRLSRTLKDPIDVLNTLDINTNNYSMFRRAFGPIMAKLSDQQKIEVTQYLESRNVFPVSLSNEKEETSE